MIRFENLVKAMRKDLGLSNWMLEEGDLLRVALNDFDEEFADTASIVPPEPEEEPRIRATTPARGAPK